MIEQLKFLGLPELDSGFFPTEEVMTEYEIQMLIDQRVSGDDLGQESVTSFPCACDLIIEIFGRRLLVRAYLVRDPIYGRDPSTGTYPSPLLGFVGSIFVWRRMATENRRRILRLSQGSGWRVPGRPYRRPRQ
jgi:hypothetical protein